MTTESFWSMIFPHEMKWSVMQRARLFMPTCSYVALESDFQHTSVGCLPAWRKAWYQGMGMLRRKLAVCVTTIHYFCFLRMHIVRKSMVPSGISPGSDVLLRFLATKEGSGRLLQRWSKRCFNGSAERFEFGYVCRRCGYIFARTRARPQHGQDAAFFKA